MQELQDWRDKLNTQVTTYQGEMSNLRTAVKSDINNLRSEFEQLRQNLRQKLDTTAQLARGELLDDDASDAANPSTETPVSTDPKGTELSA